MNVIASAMINLWSSSLPPDLDYSEQFQISQQSQILFHVCIFLNVSLKDKSFFSFYLKQSVDILSL